MAKPILPPDAARVAQDAGPVIQQEYEDVGLTCYRVEIPAGDSGNTIVEEGYIERIELPTGKVLFQHRRTRTVTREWAENNR